MIPIQAIGVDISYHVSNWAILNAHFVIDNSIGDKVVSDIDMPGALAAGSPVQLFSSLITLSLSW